MAYFPTHSLNMIEANFYILPFKDLQSLNPVTISQYQEIMLYAWKLPDLNGVVVYFIFHLKHRIEANCCLVPLTSIIALIFVTYSKLIMRKTISRSDTFTF
jgi:hypothetical protein